MKYSHLLHNTVFTDYKERFKYVLTIDNRLHFIQINICLDNISPICFVDMIHIKFIKIIKTMGIHICNYVRSQINEIYLQLYQQILQD